MRRRLSASLDEHQTAKQRADKAYRARLVENGYCVRCAKRPRKTDAQRCDICTAKAADAAWRSRRGREKAKGPRPTRGILGWNFQTDDLITEHLSLARKEAWRVKARVPSSSSADIDDMIGDALYGLVVAGRTFDEDYRVPFGAWATKQIRGAIYDGMRRWTRGDKWTADRSISS